MTKPGLGKCPFAVHPTTFLCFCTIPSSTSAVSVSLGTIKVNAPSSSTLHEDLPESSRLVAKRHCSLLRSPYSTVILITSRAGNTIDEWGIGDLL